MKYEIIETEFMGVTKKSISLDLGEGNFLSFPADEANPDYQVYLAWLAEQEEK